MFKTVTVSIPAYTLITIITVTAVVATQLVRKFGAQQYADGYLGALQRRAEVTPPA